MVSHHNALCIHLCRCYPLLKLFSLPPPKHPHQLYLCLALATGLLDDSIDAGKVDVVLFDLGLLPLEALHYLGEGLEFVMQLLDVARELLDGEHYAVQLHIQLYLLL